MALKETDNFQDGGITTSIVPWLSVPNGTQAVDFYKSAFGATEVYHLDTPDGGVVARLSIKGAEFWLSAEPPKDDVASVQISHDIPVRMIFTVADPDTIFNQALKAGASEIFAVGEGHGWRLGRLVDPFGHHWEIGHPLAS
ncbi:MAG: VOC family protein [Ginsengibacter sp.]